MIVTPVGRPPRIVEAAFWSWTLAAVLLIVGGLMAAFTGLEAMPGNFPGASLSEDQARSMAVVYRGVGLIVVGFGLGIGYLAIRTRKRQGRYRRFAVRLSVAFLLVMALLGFLVGIIIPLALFALIPLLVGSGLASRQSAVAWFAPADSDSDRDRDRT